MTDQPRPDPRRSILGTAARGTAIIAVVGLMALLVYGVFTSAPDTTIDDSLAKSESAPAPGFELPLLQPATAGPMKARLDRLAADGRLSLAELRGTPIVLNFWASWCVPCREEAPRLERAWREQRARGGPLFLGLNMQDLSDEARAFLRDFKVTYPNVREPTDRDARKWGVTGLPETFFVSARGRVAGHVIGVVSEEQLSAGIRAAEAGRPQSARQGGERRRTR